MDRFQLDAGLMMARARLAAPCHARPRWVTGSAVLGLPDTHIPLEMAVVHPPPVICTPAYAPRRGAATHHANRAVWLIHQALDSAGSSTLLFCSFALGCWLPVRLPERALEVRVLMGRRPLTACRTSLRAQLHLFWIVRRQPEGWALFFPPHDPFATLCILL